MELPRLRSSLLRWFRRTKRDLPWRRNKDAYRIWVSEVMLQQTTVATVIPYFGRFLARFPNAASLARSEEADVLALWSGLGYYSRARNLRRAAQVIAHEHAGRFPRDPDKARSLPGIGRYTANAITSIAFGACAAVVDGNVRRVISRLFAKPLPSSAEVQARADELLAPRAPGDWNEAMMELGATICTPREPRCPACPVAGHCRGKDRPEFFGAGKPRKSPVSTFVEMALVQDGNRILLERNEGPRLMRGLYELPNSGIPGASAKPRNWARKYKSQFTLSGDLLASARHTVTHHRIAVMVRAGQLENARGAANLALYSREQLASLPLGGLTLKVLRRLELLPG